MSFPRLVAAAAALLAQAAAVPAARLHKDSTDEHSEHALEREARTLSAKECTMKVDSPGKCADARHTIGRPCEDFFYEMDRMWYRCRKGGHNGNCRAAGTFGKRVPCDIPKVWKWMVKKADLKGNRMKNWPVLFGGPQDLVEEMEDMRNHVRAYKRRFPGPI